MLRLPCFYYSSLLDKPYRVRPVADKHTSLVFVYNADSGLFNTVTDIAHKIFSPDTYACSLCQITHGNFSMREEWKEFIESLELSCDFLHKDEASELLPGFDDFPAVFRKTGSGVELCLPSSEIDKCQSIRELQEAIQSRCLSCDSSS